MRRRLMSASGGSGGEYIEGTATGQFIMKINGVDSYTVTPAADGK